MRRWACVGFGVAGDGEACRNFLLVSVGLLNRVGVVGFGLLDGGWRGSGRLGEEVGLDWWIA